MFKKVLYVFKFYFWVFVIDFDDLSFITFSKKEFFLTYDTNVRYIFLLNKDNM